MSNDDSEPRLVLDPDERMDQLVNSWSPAFVLRQADYGPGRASGGSGQARMIMAAAGGPPAPDWLSRAPTGSPGESPYAEAPDFSGDPAPAFANVPYGPTPEDRPGRPVPTSCDPSPAWVTARIRDFPQTDSDPNALPVPFGSDEVRSAISAVQRARPGPVLCVRGIGGAEMTIAKEVADALETWGRSNGWVTANGQTFHLADKLYELRQRGRRPLAAQSRPPSGTIPLDLDSVQTTFDKQVAARQEPQTEPPPAWTQDPDQVRAYERALLERTPAKYRQRPGFRANMAGRMDEVMRAVQAESRYGVVSSGPSRGSRATETGAPTPVMNLMNYFPVMQTHSIKG